MVLDGSNPMFFPDDDIKFKKAHNIYCEMCGRKHDIGYDIKETKHNFNLTLCKPCVKERYSPEVYKGKLDYTPKYKAGDISKVVTDITVGTGAEARKYSPLIAGAIVYKKGKKYLRKVRKRKRKRKSKLFYPNQMKKKYPVVTKRLKKLSKDYHIKKPKLTYGKNERLATFYPPKTIRLSKKLRKESKQKRKDVAEHEFKHYLDINKTKIRDIDLLEKRASNFEKKIK